MPLVRKGTLLVDLDRMFLVVFNGPEISWQVKVSGGVLMTGDTQPKTQRADPLDDNNHPGWSE